MNLDRIKLAGRISKEKRDLQRLGELITRLGLDKMTEAEVAAIVASAYHENQEWLRTTEGRRVYTRAWSTLEGSEWQSLLEPTHIEMMRFRKEWDAKCYGDDGTAT